MFKRNADPLFTASAVASTEHIRIHVIRSDPLSAAACLSYCTGRAANSGQSSQSFGQCAARHSISALRCSCKAVISGEGHFVNIRLSLAQEISVQRHAA